VSAPTTAGTRRAIGLVVASHGRQLDVEDEAGTRHACRLHGRDLRVVCGDRVGFGYAAAGDAQATVYELLPRSRLLQRLSGRGQAEPVVANLTQLLVVVSPQPSPDWDVVDRYFAGAEWASLPAALVLNKCDLPASTSAALATELAAYVALGYPAISSSTRAAPGTDALRSRLRGAISVLVGQSGTGKSSLLNALVPTARAVTQEISAASEEGRHTTTTSALHHLAGGGSLIDSPGVRDYAPPLPLARQIGEGYREIHAASAGCRFADCLHRAEPQCAVRAQVQTAGGSITPRRYGSYLRLLELVDHFDGPARRDDPRPRSR
jgi:ribosome biogenesis GTPase